jgi:hypothetical protein
MKHSILCALVASALLPSSALAQVAPQEPSLIAPPRRSGWEFAVTPRLFLSLERLAVGTITDLTVVHRFAAPVALRVGVEPLSGAIGQGSFASFNGYAGASFDTRFFEVGLDLGLATINGNDGMGGNSLRFEVGQRMRIGVADGLHLAVRSRVYTGDTRFRWSGIVVSAQVPITRGVALVARGGAGADGFALGEIGARVRVRGDGGAGTLTLVPSAGYGFTEGAMQCASVAQAGGPTWCGNIEQSGPMVGLGVDYRL